MTENVMPTFHYTANTGCDGIEIDINMTSDKVPVIFHDRHINEKLIKDMSLIELQNIPLGQNSDPLFPQQLAVEAKVPTLAEFFEFMNTKMELTLNLEIKSCVFHPDETWPAKDFVKCVLNLLNEYEVSKERVFFQSFDPRFLMSLFKADPAWRTSFLVDEWSDDLAEVCEELQVSDVSPRFSVLNADKCAYLLENGLKIHAWTPNTPSHWQYLHEWGVETLITDEPAKAVEWRKSLSS